MAKGKSPIEAPTLQSVCERLDVVISLLMPRAGSPADVPTGLGFEILKLCDYEHTTEEITKAVGKTTQHVNKELSLLRSKGLIRTVKRDDRLVHVRLR